MSMRLTPLPLAAILLTACNAPKVSELEQVAKDWCLTIRASQVLPVYPLSEDLQPGDVFLVQVPLSQQIEQYTTRGFLPLDQLVTRLDGLPYQEFYEPGYFTGNYGAVPHARPGWPGEDSGDGAGNADQDLVQAPRAAFPTYNFSVERGAGLKLAIPIQGVPVGLGVLGADRAQGSVTISDAYTYGVDSESLMRALVGWWRDNRDVRDAFRSIAAQTAEPIYLRVISRVYLTRGVDVALTNLESVSAGVDAGAAQGIELPDLSGKDAQKLEASAQAYREALEALSGALTQELPGGSFRFTMASQRSVGLKETFDRPLVIGYLGFDLLVLEDGNLSAPIPSFASINDQIATSNYLDTRLTEIGFEDSPETRDLDRRYGDWIDVPANRQRMVEWLQAQGRDLDPADLIGNAEERRLLERAAEEFGF